MPTPLDAPLGTGFVVNGRFRSQRITGVQRYAHEIVARLSPETPVFSPRSGRGAVGHLWEQTVLPVHCKGRLLWSPNASGPLTYAKQVVTFHDLFPIEHPEWYSATYSKWYGVTMRKLAKNAVHLIAVSEYTKGRLVTLFHKSPDDITVIHNGSHMKGPANQDGVDEAASALSLPTRRYVLSLSSIEQRKNLHVLLEAWRAIHQQLPEDVWLVLAGPKASESVYSRQNLPTDLPRVLYTGYVSEKHLAGLYTGATMFVFPSIAEGFGLPLLEAMACGCRCIAASTTSLPEVGGNAVIYVDPLDFRELAGAMLHHLLKCPVTREPFAPSLERARMFSWSQAAARTQTVLSAALSRHRVLTPVPV